MRRNNKEKCEGKEESKWKKKRSDLKENKKREGNKEKCEGKEKGKWRKWGIPGKRWREVIKRGVELKNNENKEGERFKKNKIREAIA